MHVVFDGSPSLGEAYIVTDNEWLSMDSSQMILLFLLRLTNTANLEAPLAVISPSSLTI